MKHSIIVAISFLGATCTAFCAAKDHAVTEFPRLAGETDDTPRFQRAVDACRGGGLLTVPSGDYEFASTLYITNLCSVQMSPAAIIRAVKPMKWMVEIDCTWEYQRKKAPADVYSRNFNLSWSGGILDGCGLASCLALDNFAHFTLERATFNNGRIYGVGVETRGRGYELMARDLYFHTSIPGLEGNTALYTYGGDSHFIDIVAVNYTIGIHLAGRGSNRISRCHVWGVSTRPLVKGRVPETLKESVCFWIDATDTVMRDCYADTGNIGFWMNGWEERMECCSYAGLKLLKDSVVIRQNRGSIWANGFYARRISPNSVLYTCAQSADSRIRWDDDCILGPFGGKPKGMNVESTADWARKAWTSTAPDSKSAAKLLIAACDYWETTCEKDAREKGVKSWEVVSNAPSAAIASDPFALFAVWRFYWSTMSRPGADRNTAERILSDAAKVADGLPSLDVLQRTAIYSAAYDVTGLAVWREKEVALAAEAITAAEKCMNPQSAATEAKRRARILLMLLSRSEKEVSKKDRYTAILVNGPSSGGTVTGSTDLDALMDYWYGRRHSLFLNNAK